MLAALAAACSPTGTARLRACWRSRRSPVVAFDPWAVLASRLLALVRRGGGDLLRASRFAPVRSGKVRGAALEQLVGDGGDAPMLLALFQEVSLVSPLANAIAIPLVSLVVVPLTLAGAFLGAGLLLDAAHQLMAWLMVPLGVSSRIAGRRVREPRARRVDRGVRARGLRVAARAARVSVAGVRARVDRAGVPHPSASACDR
jgi:hypothetical protein